MDGLVNSHVALVSRHQYINPHVQFYTLLLMRLIFRKKDLYKVKSHCIKSLNLYEYDWKNGTLIF